MEVEVISKALAGTSFAPLAAAKKIEKQPEVAPKRQPKKDALGRAFALGRRKDATARVIVKSGTGKCIVNKRDIKTYFGRAVLRMVINQPFAVTNTENRFDIVCNVSGGGLSGQAGAILMGIARALVNFDPDYHPALRQAGFLTRDSRVVERKKPGQKKARKKFQFSKR
ncbi:MAG: 30S ribosomal protein S9 [Rickettsiales bacterium]